MAGVHGTAKMTRLNVFVFKFFFFFVIGFSVHGKMVRCERGTKRELGEPTVYNKGNGTLNYFEPEH